MGIKARILFASFSVLAIAVSYFQLCYINFKEYDKKFSLLNNERCSLLNLPAAPEDFVFFRNRYIISAVNDNINYF